MPRVYKPDPRGSRYKKYSEEYINEAVEDYKTSNKSLKFISDKYNINKSVLYRHTTRTMKKHGGQTILSEDTEKKIIRYINICAEWGYPLDSLDLRFLVKSYLDKIGRTVLKFKGNLPGPDFVASFLKRHKDEISQRNCQNIKRNRAAVSADSIQDYFRELEASLAGIDPSNIVNYDETNLTDDPGRKKIITKRGTKYPERVMNHSKASTSVMMSATAAGDLLPPYVVYKAQNLYDTWRENGPPGARYNRTQSGWFDANTFEDWIKTIVLPYFRNKEGKKCLIGDNLSSHLSLDIIKLCHEENISFVFLPANSTHLTQPLDVAFFRPVKIAWRNILVRWKKTDGKTQASVPKGCFPRLLKKLIEDLNENARNNILAGFKKTGICPIDQNQVLSRLPHENTEQNEDAVDKSVLDILKEMRYGSMNIIEPKRKRKLDVIPGRSVGSNNDSEDYVETEAETSQKAEKENKAAVKRNKTNEKGKGKGKKSKNQDHEINNQEEEKTERGNENKTNGKGKGKGKKSKKQDHEINNKEEEKTEEGKSHLDIEENITLNECDNLQEINFNSLGGDNIETMPILFEEFLLYGEDIVINEAKLSPSLEPTDTKDVTQNVGLITPINTSYKEYYDRENKKDRIQILADEKLCDITHKRKVTLNKCIKIPKNMTLMVSKKNSEPQPSTSSSKVIPSRRTSYYKNNSDILRDLLDENI